jgi:uncharacterized protein (TIGR00255 family)
MTGYGRAHFEIAGLGFEVEVRSVNHRYLDARVKLPRLLADREHGIKASAQEKLRRGKVDISVSAASDVGSAVVEVDREAAAQYVAAARELGERFELAGALDVATLLALPGVTRMVEPELAESELDAALGAAVGRALDALDAMREREGAVLAAELESRLGRVVELTRELESRSDRVREAARERLRRRSQQLEQETGLLDAARLHQEIVIAADRLDITEELVRLRSHVEQFRSILSEASREDPVGRRLDFLLQEMGREANTTGSKANDADLAHFVVELKTELERLREQVQNIE